MLARTPENFHPADRASVLGAVSICLVNELHREISIRERDRVRDS